MVGQARGISQPHPRAPVRLVQPQQPAERLENCREPSSVDDDARSRRNVSRLDAGLIVRNPRAHCSTPRLEAELGVNRGHVEDHGRVALVARVGGPIVRGLDSLPSFVRLHTLLELDDDVEDLLRRARDAQSEVGAVDIADGHALDDEVD